MTATTKNSRGTIVLHENLILLEVEGAAQMEELQALPEVRAAIVKILTPACAVLDAERLQPMLEALEKHGLLPRLNQEEREG